MHVLARSYTLMGPSKCPDLFAPLYCMRMVHSGVISSSRVVCRCVRRIVHQDVRCILMHSGLSGIILVFDAVDCALTLKSGVRKKKHK